MVVDGFKTCMIFMGVAGHAITCLESLPGWYSVHRLEFVTSCFRIWWTQALFNEGGLSIITVMGGFVTYWSVAPLIKSAKFRYLSTVLERWLKFVPIIMTMVGLEICWTLIGSGSMYKRVADSSWTNVLTQLGWTSYLWTTSNMPQIRLVSHCPFDYDYNLLPSIITVCTTLVLLIHWSTIVHHRGRNRVCHR